MWTKAAKLQRIAIVAALFYLPYTSHSALAQDRLFPSGNLPLLTSDEVTKLLHILETGEPENWECALRLYFGEAHLPELADLVVFIPNSKVLKPQQALIWKGKRRTRLDGKKHVWVIVFSDATFRTCRKCKDLELKLTSLDFQRDQFVVALAKSLVAGLGRSGLEASEVRPVPRDTTVELKMAAVGKAKDGRTLYVQSHRFALNQNSTNRISIRPAADTTFPSSRRIQANFPNGRSTRFSFSFGPGVTFPVNARAETDSSIVEAPKTSVKLNVFLHWAVIKRPYPPWQPWSISLTGGTNLFTGSSFEDLLLGLSIIKSDPGLGIVVGVNVHEEKRTRREDGITKTKEQRKLRGYLGLSISL